MMILSVLPGRREPDDAALLTAITGDDQTALSLLYDRHAPLLYSIVYRILQEKQEAEDILQEVFVLVWQKASTYDAVLGNPEAWLARIARNRAVDRLRSKTYRARSQEMDIDDHEHSVAAPREDDPEQHTLLSQQRTEIAAAMALLPREQQELIELAYFRGFTQQELSARFSIPLGTVKTRMRTALHILRDALRAHRP